MSNPKRDFVLLALSSVGKHDGRAGIQARKLTQTMLNGGKIESCVNEDRRAATAQFASHWGLLEPRGTSTVLKEPGVRDMTTWSVSP